MPLDANKARDLAPVLMRHISQSVANKHAGRLKDLSVYLAIVLRPLPAQTLVDLLKHPLCAREARRIVLNQLGSCYGRRFEDQWDFVRFAEEQKLGLDFTRRPQRP